MLSVDFLIKKKMKKNGQKHVKKEKKQCRSAGREYYFKAQTRWEYADVFEDIMPHGLNTCCLLYTSPSPRDLSTSRMPSSA